MSVFGPQPEYAAITSGWQAHSRPRVLSGLIKKATALRYILAYAMAVVVAHSQTVCGVQPESDA